MPCVLVDDLDVECMTCDFCRLWPWRSPTCTRLFVHLSLQELAAAALAAALATAALATARAAAALATAARLQYGIEWCRLSWRRVFYRQWLSMPVVECPGTAALSLTDASQIPGQRAGRGAQLLSQPGTKIEYMVATNALVLHAECFSPL